MNKQTATFAIFAVGAIMLAVHLFQKLVTGVGSAGAEDAIAVMVLAGTANYLFCSNQ